MRGAEALALNEIREICRVAERIIAQVDSYDAESLRICANQIRNHLKSFDGLLEAYREAYDEMGRGEKDGS